MGIVILLAIIVIIAIVFNKLLRNTPRRAAKRAKRVLYQKVISKDNPLTFEIAGLYYRSSDAHETARKLPINTSLSAELEPNNKFDEFAVKIMYKDVHLGYIPNYYSKPIFLKLKDGGECAIEITSNDRTEIPHIWVRLYPTKNSD